MKKALRFPLLITVATILIMSFSLCVSANTIPQISGNTTPETAQEIQRNTQTPTEYMRADNTHSFVLSGNLTSSSDENWYKVYLPSDTSGINTVLAINCTCLSAEVYDPSGNRVLQKQYVRSSKRMGARPYFVDVTSSGYYYIRVFGLVGTNGNYLLTIGNPIYCSDSYTYQATTPLSLSKTVNSSQLDFNINSTDVPDYAIVYSVGIAGIRDGSATNETRYISYRNGSFQQSRNFVWSVDYSLTQNVPLVSKWTVKVTGVSNKGYSYTPKVSFSYVFPLLPDLF